jgi:hypothetical protein
MRNYKGTYKNGNARALFIFYRDKQIDIHQAYYHIIRQLLFVQKVIHLKDVTLQPNKIINNIQTSNKG